MAPHHRDTVITGSSRTRMMKPLTKSMAIKRQRNTVSVSRLKSAIPTADAAIVTGIAATATRIVSHV